nr:hypothetical protein [uncultured Flavobacterium sp.]
MKKIIESELISIAHRILKLKDKSDIDILYNESKNLFEKLSVLKFYEENKFRIDPSITEENLEKALLHNSNMDFSIVKEMNFDDPNMNIDLINELIEDSESSEIISFDEPVSFNEEEEITETPIVESENISKEESTIENVSEEIVLEKKNIVEVEIDSIYSLPTEDIFVEKQTETTKNTVLENQHFIDTTDKNEVPFHEIPLNKTINDAFSHTIIIGLNDRIAFEKNLFNGSSEDLNRVISQLNTMTTFQEAQDFIDDLVKPDFNYWKGKEEYELRFMELIQKRF